MRIRIAVVAALATVTAGATALPSSGRVVPATGQAGSDQHAVACARRLVDDFSSGAYRSADLRSGSVDATQTGTMIGGKRLVRLGVQNNVHRMPSTLAISHGAMVLSSGYQAPTAVQIWYGVDSAGVGAPLHADLSCYDRFRIRFDAIDLQLNVNVLIYYAGGARYGQCGENTPADANTDYVAEFRLDCFRDGAGRAVEDWTDITYIGLLVQYGGAVASNDYAISTIALAGTS